jgi:hypothetical protein
MKSLLIVTVALTVGASCTSHSSLSTNESGIGQITPTPESVKPSPLPDSKVTEKVKNTNEVPNEFKKTDFKNLSYPISLEHRTIPLKDGHAEYYADKDLGNAWFDFTDVNYIDLTGDGKKEAIVQLLAVMCGASCDGGSQYFYFYSSDGRRLTLLTRIETGSLGYGECGLRSFILEKKSLVLETFQVCRFDGTLLKPTGDPHPNPDAKGGKFMADKVTRFVLEFERSRFRLKNREVFQNPQEDIQNYRPKVIITND